MADPLSLVTTIVSLVIGCGKVTTVLRDLKQSYSDAPSVLQALAVDCTTTTVVLQRLEHVLRSNPQLLAAPSRATQNLKSSFETLVQDIFDSILRLGKEVGHIANVAKDGSVDMSNSSRAKFMWKEELLRSSLQEIREYRSALSFLLDCIQMESLVNIQARLGGGSNQMIQSTQHVSSNSRNDASQLSLNQLSLKPNGRLSFGVFLPRELDDPQLQDMKARLRPKPGKTHKGYNIYAAEEIHLAVQNNKGQKLTNKLRDRWDPDMTLPNSKLTPLHRALAEPEDRSGIIYVLVMAGANIHAKSEDGFAPLILALRAKMGYDLIKLMCELGAKVNEPDPKGLTPLHYAAIHGAEDRIIMALVGHGANVNQEDDAGETPLFEAIRYHRPSVARKLLSYGCDPNQESKTAATALFATLLPGKDASLEMVKMLCDNGANVSHVLRRNSPLTFAIVNLCGLEIAKILITAGANVNFIPEDGLSPLYCAVMGGNADIAIHLIKAGAKVDLKSRQQRAPIHMAAELESTDMLKLLLQHGALVDPVDFEGWTPLAMAARMNKLDTMKILIEHGAYLDCETDGQASPIFIAMVNRHPEAARLLIESGVDLDSPALSLGLRPIHQAAMYGLDDIVRLILDYGISIESLTTEDLYTPLMAAVAMGRMSTVRLLLERGADLHAKTETGSEVLACSLRHPAMVRFILSLGLDVNAQDKSGSTALHEAVVQPDNEIASARVLLQKGAKQFHADEVWELDGSKKKCRHSGTPAQIARAMGKVQLAELIENWGGKT